MLGLTLEHRPSFVEMSTDKGRHDPNNRAMETWRAVTTIRIAQKCRHLGGVVGPHC
jgi:hypothetical protein